MRTKMPLDLRPGDRLARGRGIAGLLSSDVPEPPFVITGIQHLEVAQQADPIQVLLFEADGEVMVFDTHQPVVLAD